MPFPISLVISAAFLSADPAAARIPLGRSDADDERGIVFRVFNLHIFYYHSVDAGDEFR